MKKKTASSPSAAHADSVRSRWNDSGPASSVPSYGTVSRSAV